MLAIDTETFPFAPGEMAPKIICLTTSEGEIYHRDDAYEPFLKVLQKPVVGQNIAYDMGCAARTWPHILPAIFEAYDRKLVHDTMLAAQLYRISRGELKRYPRYSLQALAKRWLNQDLTKDETRTTFHLYDHLPIAKWPREYVEYAIKDAVTTEEIWDSIDYTLDVPEQCQYAFALHLMGIWGIATDLETVAEYKEELKQEYDSIYEDIKFFFKDKFVNGKPSKSLDVIRDAVTRAFDGHVPTEYLTPKGAVSTSRATLEKTKDRDLEALAEFQKISTYVNTYIPLLEREIIHVRYGLAETGRTTASPNIQNQPRKGRVRECYVPRDGYLFCSCDYSQIEMCALAQILTWLFGESQLADALNAGIDVHMRVAAQLQTIAYDYAIEHKDEMKDARQLSKIANFGFPGGLGTNAFVDYAHNFGTTITLQESVNLKRSWLKAWPKMHKYFANINNLVKSDGILQQFISKRVRGDVTYTKACNSTFQGLTADGAKSALYAVQKECYLPGSDLFGTRPVAFIHDEILAEVPIEKAHLAASRLSTVMISEMKKYIPDIKIEAEPALMERWYKEAKPTYNKGKLTVWFPGE